MTRLEMVEKIHEKTGVTYEQARETLEKCNWDMLDAIVAIEHMNAASAKKAEPAFEGTVEDPQPIQGEPAPKKRVIRISSSSELGDKVAAALKWLGALIKKGEETHFEISRKEDLVMSISVTSLLLVFLLSWFIPLLLIIAGLFTGYRFRFTGNSVAGKIANSAVNKASAKADEIKTKMSAEEETDQ